MAEKRSESPLYDNPKSKEAHGKKPERREEKRDEDESEKREPEKKGDGKKAEGGGMHERHRAEREALHQAHRVEHRDMHGNHRAERDQMHARHQKARDEMNAKQEAEMAEAQGGAAALGARPKGLLGLCRPAARRRLSREREAMWSKLVDMEMDDEDQLDLAPAGAAEKPRYPYGLRICLTNDELAKLGLDADCSIGDVIDLRAFATVTSVSQNDFGNGPECRVELQIEKLAVENEATESET